jgi:NADPH:quinone reductase-like Zn-dependent oxidoreductase
MVDSFYISKYGKSVALQRGQLPPKVLGTRDVRIDVYAASVNPLDLKIRDGALKVLLPYQFPLVLGNDCSGVITEVGAKVTRFKVGDAVYTRLREDRIGAFAQEAVTDESAVAHKPVSLTYVQAASLPLVLLTAKQFLSDAAHLVKGQSVLVHAGAGAVGCITIQLAKYMGLKVVTTASTDNIEYVKDIGADVVIDRKTQRFEDSVRGMNAVLDSVGMGNLLKSFQCVVPGATVVSIADGPDVALARELKINRMLWPVFYFMGAKAHAAAGKAGASYRFLFMRANGEQLEGMNPLLDNGTLRTYIDSVFPFDQTTQALARAESGQARGKVVIQIKNSPTPTENPL